MTPGERARVEHEISVLCWDLMCWAPECPCDGLVEAIRSRERELEENR